MTPEEYRREFHQLLAQVQDPGRLKEMMEVMFEIQSEKDAEIKRLRKAIDERERAKQLFLSKEVGKELHRLKRVAFGFGREKNKLRDRERLKTERQLTLQSKGLVEEIEAVSKNELPEQVVEHRLEEEEFLEHCQVSGLEINEGDEVECVEVKDFYEESREITVTERVYTQVVHRRMKYKARNLTTGEEKIVTTPGPVKLYPKSQFSVDFAVQAVCDKFLNHLPYERQRRELNRSGFDVPLSTHCRLERAVAAHLEAMAEKIRHDILNTEHLAVGLDETRWPILVKDHPGGYFWIICNQAGSYYRFEPSRSGEIARELLKHYRGSVISDKFSGYLQFSKNTEINWGLCLAHARRDFVSLQDYHPEECGEVLELMDRVFKLEHEARTWEELDLIRKTKSKPLMEELKVVLQKLSGKFLPGDKMTEAINYVLSGWPQFVAFIDDLSLPVSNNESERALRQAVLGRKNYRGSKTIDAADQAAVIFSIVESCKKVELDPKDYIKYVIENNHHGRESLTPLKLALERRGKSQHWPNAQGKTLAS